MAVSATLFALTAGAMACGAGSGTTGDLSLGDASTDDGGSADGQRDEDASVDANETAAPRSSGCAMYSEVAFCDDFENPGAFALNWPTINGTPPVVTTSATAYSPLHVASAVGSRDGGEHSLMQRGLPTVLVTQRLRVAFSFRVIEGGDFVYLGALSLNAANGDGLNVAVTIQQGELNLEVLNNADSGFPSPDAGSPWIPLAKVGAGLWMRLELDFDLSNTGSVKAIVDAIPIANIAYAPGHLGYTGTYGGDLQLEAVNGSVDYDDVVLWQL